jgi:hypothetical protein
MLTRNSFFRYYEQQGFQVVVDFSLPRSHKEPWIGCLVQMTILDHEVLA